MRDPVYISAIVIAALVLGLVLVAPWTAEYLSTRVEFARTPEGTVPASVAGVVSIVKPALASGEKGDSGLIVLTDVLVFSELGQEGDKIPAVFVNVRPTTILRDRSGRGLTIHDLQEEQRVSAHGLYVLSLRKLVQTREIIVELPGDTSF